MHNWSVHATRIPFNIGDCHFLWMRQPIYCSMYVQHVDIWTFIHKKIQSSVHGYWNGAGIETYTHCPIHKKMTSVHSSGSCGKIKHLEKVIDFGTGFLISVSCQVRYIPFIVPYGDLENNARKFRGSIHTCKDGSTQLIFKEWLLYNLPSTEWNRI